MTSLNNISTIIGPALTAVSVGMALALGFSFCQYFSERRRRREFRNSRGLGSKDSSGQTSATISVTPSLWNWVAGLWNIKPPRLETEPFPSFLSYFIHHIGRYSFAIGSVTLVLIVRWLLEPVLEGSMPFSFFLAAVLFTARTQGIWETLLALALGFLLGTWFFADPKNSFSFSGQHDWWAAAIYIIVSLGIVWFLKSEQTAWLRTLSSDISALKQLWELQQERAYPGQLQRTREWLASLVENAEGAILSTGLDGRILTWNAAANRLLGWSASEIIGRPLADLLPLNRQPELQQILQQISRGERLSPWHVLLHGQNGSRTEVTMSIAPVKDHLGRLQGISFIVPGQLSQPNGLPGGQ